MTKVSLNSTSIRGKRKGQNGVIRLGVSFQPRLNWTREFLHALTPSVFPGAPLGLLNYTEGATDRRYQPPEVNLGDPMSDSNQSNRSSRKFPGLRLVQPSSSTMQLWADRLGLCLSVACLIHCLATPVLLIALPGLSFLVAEHDHGHGLEHNHEILHQVLLVILPLLAVLAFIPGYRMHGKRQVFYWAFPGIVALAIGVILAHDYAGVATAVTILGSVLLVRAHLLNRKECACCATGHGHKLASRLSRTATSSKPITKTVRLTEVKSGTSKSKGERVHSGEL